MGRFRLIIFAAVAVVLLSAAIGMRARIDRDAETPAAVLPLTIAPAVVVATRPTLSEILDIVLRERPTASELAYSGGDFPSGSDEAYVAGILSRRNANKSLVHRISAALVKEGRRRNIESQLLVGVLLTENPWLDPRAKSPVGARGLMQVMPFQAGKWGCRSADLFDVDANICHGVAVLADNLERSRTLHQALRGYNGCVRGTNTPDCWRYPGIVRKRGGLGK
ncbi:MAG TPA: transglycosylase SLT domain-containing protein [Gemmatimonadaceae bacterium]|nr:transglycosylase SLT domain-containing protein [Gemmatimonadaceae bacterium]